MFKGKWHVNHKAAQHMTRHETKLGEWPSSRQIRLKSARQELPRGRGDNLLPDNSFPNWVCPGSEGDECPSIAGKRGGDIVALLRKLMSWRTWCVLEFRSMKQTRKKTFTDRFYVFTKLPHDKQQLLPETNRAWSNRSGSQASLAWHVTAAALQAKIQILKHFDLRRWSLLRAQ